MSINPYFKVFHTDTGPAHFQLDYDSNPNHHAIKTCDGAIRLASEWLHENKLPIRIKDDRLIEDNIMMIDENGVHLNFDIRESLEASFDERFRMLAELWQAWWQKHEFRVIQITQDRGGNLFPLATRTFSSSTRPDILVQTVQVLLGAKFTFTLVERSETWEKPLLIIHDPADGSFHPIGTRSEHDLSYQLQSHDEGRFHINVVYKEVAPRMIADIRPLATSE